jgi:hypothetical protein
MREIGYWVCDDEAATWLEDSLPLDQKVCTGAFPPAR